MSSRPEGLGPATRIRPKQERAQDSLARTLKATEELMQELGPSGFALTDVAARADVSIASIYYRFNGKEALASAVLRERIQKLDDAHNKMLDKATRQSENLAAFINLLINGMASIMRREAWLLHLMTAKAQHDKDIRLFADWSYKRNLGQVSSALMQFQDEILHPDPAVAAESIFRVVYAALAGMLGFGLNDHGAAGKKMWSMLERDLQTMSLDLLRTPRASSDEEPG